MSDIVFTAIADADGSIAVLRGHAAGADASSVPVSPGSTAHQVPSSALPAMDGLRSAWRIGADGASIVVDMPTARTARLAALAETAATLSDHLNKLALGHMVDGNDTQLAVIKALKAQVLADASVSLADITDAATLASYEPDSFAQARAAT